MYERRQFANDSRRPLIEFAMEAGRIAGLDLDEVYADKHGRQVRYPGFSAETTDGQRWVSISRDKDDTSDGLPKELVPYQVGWTAAHRSTDLRGLLVREKCKVNPRLKNYPEDPYSARSEEWFTVSTYASPRQTNEVQKMFGRTPGQDALTVTPSGVFGAIPGNLYVPAFARMQRPVTSLGNAYEITHDLDPYGHGTEWIMTPGSICIQVAQHCADTVDQFSEDQLAEDAPTPEALKNLTRALDSWGTYHVKDVHDAVSMVEYPDALDSDQSAVDYFRALMHSAPHTSDQYSKERADIRRLQILGLIPDVKSRKTQRLALSKVRWQVARHVIETKLRLEEIMPKKDDTLANTTVRKNTWKTILEEVEEKLEIS